MSHFEKKGLASERLSAYNRLAGEEAEFPPIQLSGFGPIRLERASSKLGGVYEEDFRDSIRDECA